MDDSLEQPSALRYVETRTTTGEHAQNRISDERLAKLAKLDCPAAHWGDFQCHLCERRKMARELTALRASHAGLKHAVEYTLRCLEETGWDQEIHSSVPGTLRGALAETRKLEGK